MTCHKCRHSREIAQLAEKQAQLREICAKCRLGEDLAGDGSVSLDTIHDGAVERVVPVAPNHKTAYNFDPGEIDEAAPEIDEATRTRDALTTLLACVAALPYEQVARLATIADTFRALTRTEFEIVAYLLNGGTMTEYADEYGLTTQTAFARIKALFKAHPVFRAIASGNLGRGKGGRVARPRPEVQLDFFDILEGC